MLTAWGLYLCAEHMVNLNYLSDSALNPGRDGSVPLCVCACVRVSMRICFSETIRGCFGSHTECCIWKASPLVCPHKLSHDSKHEWRLAVTHTAPFDRFGEHTDAQKVACSSTFLSPGKAQEAVACQQHKRILFVPMAVSSKGEAARLDKTPRKWDGELPLQLTDRHRSPAVLPAVSLSRSVSLFWRAFPSFADTRFFCRDAHTLTSLLKKMLNLLIWL